LDTKRIAIALVVALVLTGAATYAFYRLRGPGGAAVPMRKVVIASKELAAGSVLKAEDLTTADWPVNLATTGVFSKVDEVVGRAVVYPVGEKDIIRERDLAAAGSGLGLASKIPPGMRAVSVRSNEVVGVAGFLYPGSRVDVLATLRPVGGDSAVKEPLTQTILQDVEVLTAGQRIQPDPEGKPQTVNVVTLLLNPEDSQKLMLAAGQATIQFVLRSGADKEKVETESVSVADLLGKSKKGTLPPPPPRRATPGRRLPPTEAKTPKPPNFYTVEVIQGEKRSEEKFE
jgi:pilus assembly protein CpaB